MRTACACPAFVYWMLVLGSCCDCRELESAQRKLEAAQETEKFNLNHWLSSPLSVHAYVVSVPTSERRARMSSRLQHHNVPFTFVDGMQPEVQSHDIRVRQASGHLDVTITDHPPAGQCNGIKPARLRLKSCSTTEPPSGHSHCLESRSGEFCRKDVAIVMEDDMEILQWPSNRLVYAAPPGWGILQLYGIEWRHDVAEDSAYTVPLQLWVPWGSGLGSTGAYIINRHGMLQVLERYLPDVHADVISTVTMADKHGEVPCDGEAAIFLQTSTYWCSDIFVHEEAGNSTLHNDDDRKVVHGVARQRVRDLWHQRGTLH